MLPRMARRNARPNRPRTMTDQPFALDHVDNPHPRMRQRALELRTRAKLVTRNIKTASTLDLAAQLSVLVEWQTYREAMCDATGCTPAQIEAWLDRDVTRPTIDLEGL